MKLYPLEEMSIPIQCEGFNPESSEVCVSLTVVDPREWKPTRLTDKRWNSEGKTFTQVIGVKVNLVKFSKTKILLTT